MVVNVAHTDSTKSLFITSHPFHRDYFICISLQGALPFLYAHIYIVVPRKCNQFHVPPWLHVFLFAESI